MENLTPQNTENIQSTQNASLPVVKKYVLKKSSAQNTQVQYKIDYEKDLNPAQLEAVKTKDGAVRVIAGAGSGKTITLTYRVARLIESGVKPDNILLLTFTKKAADEMLNRAVMILDSRCEKVSGGTFHSFSNYILRKYSDCLELRNNFTIIDRADAEDVINHIRAQVATKQEKRFPRKGTILDIYSKAVNKNMSAEAVIESEYNQFAHCVEKINEISKQYISYKRENSLLDYDDLLLYLRTLLQSNDEIRKKLSNQYKYIMIAEYQDSNSLQADIIRLLASEHNNVMAVGDDSQSIYSFRGANFRNILDFPAIFPNTKIIKLEQNYRCTGNILKAANAVIKHNENKYDKKLWTENEEGHLPCIYCGEDEYDEGRYIVEQINHLKTEEYYKNSDFTILYRMNAQSRAIEDILMREGIPYKVIGGLKFYERKEIKDIIAYLRLIHNSADNLSLKRIINEPKRGIGKTSIEQIQEISDKTGNSMYEIIRNAQEYGLTRVFSNSRDFIEQIEYLKSKKDELKISDLIKETLNKTGYTKALENENSVEAETRIENLEEFLTVAIEFEEESADNTLAEFLENITLSSDIDGMEDQDNSITLMTLHSAKGLEFPVVFLVGMEEGIFPGYKTIGEPQALEEERRLFYVGITRAKQYLYLTCAKHRTIFGSTSYNQVSRFVKEIPEELLEGYAEVVERKSVDKEEFKDYGYRWSYGKGQTVKTFKMSEEDKSAVAKTIGEQGTKSEYQYRTAESFLNSIKQNNQTNDVDLSKYQVGQRVYHKKFGEGTITKLEQEGNDVKVDLEFDKAGHKRLMAKFAGLEIIG